MSLKRVGALLGQELVHGPKTYIFIMAILLPLAISLVVNLAFGTLFTEKAKVGLISGTASGLTGILDASDALQVKYYSDDNGLRDAVERGSVDMGIVIPEGLDTVAREGGAISLTGYIWGESLAKNRVTITAAVSEGLREIAGLESPVNIESVTLGEDTGVPWNDRILPLVVLLAVFLGGLMIPATSLITEKTNKTIDALLVTPSSISDVFTAKGITGLIIALFMGILILVINQAFGNHPLLLTMVLFLGGLMAVELGLILGTVLKEFATLFSLWKMGGIILWAPVLVYLFPAIPEWVGRIFPTYYFIKPIVDISLGGGGWSEIAGNIFVLVGIDIVFAGILAVTLQRTRQFATS